MTEDDISFVKEVKLGADALIQTILTTTTRPTDFVIQAQQDAYVKLRLLTLLVEVEAEKDKAEFYKIHDEDPEDCEYCGDTSCDGSGHCYNDSDWQKAVRERWELGRKRSGRR